MNYKLLFPTYRNRYLFVEESLAEWGKKGKFGKALNLGTGEGDYDVMIAPYCNELIACDINEGDIAFARELNKDLENVQYQVENALSLSFPDNTFDLIISVDVLEHVGQPEIMIAEVARVLKPGGMAFITFPQLYFPVTYDPINRWLGYFSKKKISEGAYAFGHEYLIPGSQFRDWTLKNGLKVLNEKNLSGYLVALTEMYWTGIIQRIFKANAGNSGESRKMSLRPSTKAPGLVKLTDGLIGVDYSLFGKSKYSVGKGFVVIKETGV